MSGKVSAPERATRFGPGSRPKHPGQSSRPVFEGTTTTTSLTRANTFFPSVLPDTLRRLSGRRRGRWVRFSVACATSGKRSRVWGMKGCGAAGEVRRAGDRPRAPIVQADRRQRRFFGCPVLASCSYRARPHARTHGSTAVGSKLTHMCQPRCSRRPVFISFLLFFLFLGPRPERTSSCGADAVRLCRAAGVTDRCGTAGINDRESPRFLDGGVACAWGN